ncbi:hypothetical protein [Hippea alviniae]|uniref:hypothetical protein n=1 Tax=Hippea alviniae TaxID=1279027 RepID=UPI0003B38559|nr:hypothetical protein [Hippea alviniae]
MRHFAVFVVLPVALFVGIFLADNFLPVYYVSDIPNLNIPDVNGFKKVNFSKCSINRFAFFKREIIPSFAQAQTLKVDLESIFISQNVKYCYINGKLFKEGESGAGFRVLKINKDSVLLKTKNGNIRVSLNVEATQKN